MKVYAIAGLIAVLCVAGGGIWYWNAHQDLFGGTVTLESRVSCTTLTHDFGLGATNETTEGDLEKLVTFLDVHHFLGDARLDGTFNEQVSTALKLWQRKAGIALSGVVDAQTRISIAHTCDTQE
jgi:peptidoglycan hydrolase-like protein with peptidoglycan-binding domain